MPNLCSKTDGKTLFFHFFFPKFFDLAFSDWMLKNDPIYRDLLNWETNEFDLRNYVPEFLKEFAKPLTEFEKSKNLTKIFD